MVKPGTELIVGEGYEPKHLESLYIGCVGLSKEHFEDGKLSQKRFDRARLAARLELTPVAAVFRRYGWARAVGSSGTVRAAHDVAQGLKLVDSGISLSALETIIAALIAARRIEDAKLPGLGSDRAPVFAGGVAILAEVMSALRIERLQISGGVTGTMSVSHSGSRQSVAIATQGIALKSVTIDLTRS